MNPEGGARSMWFRGSVGLIALMLAGAAAGVPALAQSGACTPLKADLAALDRRAPAADPAGEAIARQQAALQRGMAEHDRLCSPGFLTTVSPKCPQIEQRIEAMQANLVQLQRRAAASTAVPKDDGPRQRLIALLRQNGCDGADDQIVVDYGHPAPGRLVVGGPSPAPVRERPVLTQPAGGRIFTLPGPNGPIAYREDPGGRVTQLGPASQLGTRSNPDAGSQRRAPSFLGPLFGDPQQERDPYAADPAQGGPDPLDPYGADLNGTFRTLCVRTCDGYYFPISDAASSSRFATDAGICRARCPASETRLFVHRNPGEDSEDSVAADDPAEHYSRLPNALRYRTEMVAGCTCGQADPSLLPVEAQMEETGKPVTARSDEAAMVFPLPTPKPPSSEDPETLADLDADVTPHVVMPMAAVDAATPGGSRVVRVVGPKYFEDR